MAQTAFMTQYRKDYIAGFEARQSILRDTVVKEAQIKGNQCVFLVADSGGATAVTRGPNGLIPARVDNNNQYTCTLTEWHDLVEKTNFNIFASQGDQQKIMQDTSVGVLNRKIDDQIITELATATQSTGASTTATLALVTRAKAILGLNKVPWDGRITLLMTPAFEGYLLQVPAFSNADYVDARPLVTGETAWSDTPKVYKWIGMTLISHPSLPGAGTANEQCFMYHMNAIGHAADTKGLQTPVGYDEKQDMSWARASMYMGAKLLQNSGVVVINHDGSEMVAAA